ncbi:M1 family aminopeptidase [Rufibacter sp. LB8]|uniref:M1 family aminopeptidase n=1 Tax=Rufibacter sp. LB8 TaxID=2777781 RepID=UPI00178C5686|nr:M1 family aminopeptidase [Rufibacter sp. LB8]
MTHFSYTSFRPSFLNRLKTKWGCLLLVLLLGQGIVAQAQEKDPHPCAVARLQSTSLLLADGITSEAHVALMRQYDVHWYKLDLGLERNNLNVQGNVTILATNLSSNFSEFAFELHPNLTIDRVLINGQPGVVNRTNSEVRVQMPMQVPAQQKFTAQVFYAGTAPSGASAAIGNGLNTATVSQYNAQVTWSLSEPFAASEWFPVKQLLADKADSVDVWVTTDVGNKVGSNGLLQRVTPLPNQKHRYEWKSTYPIAYYLISVAVGQYQEYTFPVTVPGATAPIPVQNFIYDHPQALAAFKPGIDNTAPLLQLFSEKFGLYPFHKEKYGHSMAPMGGGMEHQTMTTQSSFEFTLTAHELAHQWWGNEVTCAGWSHIWLNEGFASYSEYLALQEFQPGAARNWIERAAGSSTFSQGSVFVRDSTQVGAIFNSVLSYRKGAMVLHMLRHALASDALFFQVLRTYRNQYKNKVATTRDFQRVVEQVAGRSFAYFFDQWVYGEGYPIFDIRWAQQDGKLYLKSTQTGSSPNTPFFKTEMELKIYTTEKDTLVLLQQDKPVEEYSFKLKGTVVGMQLDPDQWLAEKVDVLDKDPSLMPIQGRKPIYEVGVYPNPARDEVQFLEGVGGLTEITLTDIAGRTLKSFDPRVEKTIKIDYLAPGAYLLILNYGGMVKVIKFVKL